MATLADYGPEVRAEVKQVREVVATLHEQLIKWNLVVWTAGNVSQRLHTADLDLSDVLLGDSMETLKKYPKSPAVLMQNHGPFTIGKDAEAAVKAAAMTEEVAHTMWAAKQLGDIIPISQEDIDSLNDRYTNVYGQH